MSWLGYETVYCPLIFLMKLKKKNRERERDNGILLLRERGKSFGDESNENFEKQTNKLKQINKKQFFHEGYRVRV